MLKACGYDVPVRPVQLGYAGTIYSCNMLLEDLGLHRTVAKTVLKKLHMHALVCLHTTSKTEDAWKAVVDVECGLEELGGKEGRLNWLLTLLGSLV